MATIPADVIKVSYVFDLWDQGTPIETGVFGFHGRRFHRAGNTVDWEADVQALSVKLHDGFVANVAPSYFSSAIIMNRVDVYHLSTANKTLDKGSTPFTPVGEWTGGAGTGMAWENALVVSLYGYTPGSFTQGARNQRGRFYLPPLRKDATGATDGRLALQTQTDMRSMLSTWLNGVQGTEIGPTNENPAGADYFDLGILSTQRKTVAGYQGAFTPATTFRLGRVIDVQRRRRKKQDEAYINGTIDHADD